MEGVVVKSNNVYFIKLANQEQLQEQMADLYLKTGMFLHGAGGYYYPEPIENNKQEEKWKELIAAPASVARMVIGIANNCNMLANRFLL
ncbi:hypothetical protein [Pedobacter hiemivivus]|uniref:Uncharacterized protein n=1 Tax=Pedobacter hiemivivus TaxID=2530454 RepID=A0A4R0N097_9SPHI|nr:hypothetical protein [Pedobacter hiemivivus]TCC93060.1 hypothetical protein EZ444_17470 [Pedobacter hiemivivus]